VTAPVTFQLKNDKRPALVAGRFAFEKTQVATNGGM
jgi:hypothetical protein